MIFSLLTALCTRKQKPLTANQNLLLQKLMLSPASTSLERVQLVTTGRLAERPGWMGGGSDSGGTGGSAVKAGGGGGGGGDECVDSIITTRTPVDQAYTTPAGPASFARRVKTSDGGRGRPNKEQPSACVSSGGATAVVAVGLDTVEASGQLDETVIADEEAEPPRRGSLLLTFREASLTPLRTLTPREAAAAIRATDEQPGPDGSGASEAGGDETNARGGTSHGGRGGGEVKPASLLDDVLGAPAMLSVVRRREIDETHHLVAPAKSRGGSPPPSKLLCLSPSDPASLWKPAEWTPLRTLHLHPARLDHFLSELKLLGGLCSGHNGLTLHTLRSLYPFDLCMEMLADPSLPPRLRSAACILTRQLYIESSSRKIRETEHAVWDWDALQDGTLHAACLSLPPLLVQPSDSIAEASWAAGRRRASCAGPWSATAVGGGGGGVPPTRSSMRGAGGGAAIGSGLDRAFRWSGTDREAGADGADDDGAKDAAAECAVTAPQMSSLQGFVSGFLLDHAVHSMCSGSEELVLLGGALDMCLALLRHGHMIEQGVIEQLFEVLVTTLAVKRVKPRADDGDARAAFDLALEAKTLICRLLESILDYRLRLRTAGVLRSICQASTPKSPGGLESGLATPGTALGSSAVNSPDLAVSIATSPRPGAQNHNKLPPTVSARGFAATTAARSNGSADDSFMTRAWGRIVQLATPLLQTASALRGGGRAAWGGGGWLRLGEQARDEESGGGNASYAGERRWENLQTPVKRSGTTPTSLTPGVSGAPYANTTSTHAVAATSSRTGSGRWGAEPGGGPIPPNATATTTPVGVDVYRELQRGCEMLPWQRACDEMIRALVQTSIEARGSKPELVADALRVLFTHFDQASKLAKALEAAVVVKARRAGSPGLHPQGIAGSGGGFSLDTPFSLQLPPSPDVGSHPTGEEPPSSFGGERSQALLIGRTTRSLEHVVMSLKSLASTDPLPAAAAILDNLNSAVSRLKALCTSRHQRRLHCSLGTHEAVVNAIRVLDEVENGEEGSTMPAMVDGIYRLPPDGLSNAREACFDFLAAFCGGGQSNSRKVAATSEAEEGAKLEEPQHSHRLDRSFGNRRDTFGASPRVDNGSPIDIEWEDIDVATGIGGATLKGGGETQPQLDSASSPVPDANSGSTPSAGSSEGKHEIEPANQEALFVHFDLILSQMCQVGM